MTRAPQLRLHHDDLIIDSFAGGGGASLGIEWALGRSPDIAINHDPEAIALHAANHPRTRHYCESVWKVDPAAVTGGRRPALLWASPDCKHHSNAKGGKPVDKKIRGLAWAVTRWAKAVQPRVICLENVEEFQDWGPLDDDNKPDPVQRGLTFKRWVRKLKSYGYRVEWRELRASDYGAPTSRKRLFVIARCDGLPIVWPEPTHGAGLVPWRTAAECIDWSLPVRSIFGRKHPLADNTLKRIARGIRRYVIESGHPFIIPVKTWGGGGNEPRSLEEPMRTVTASKRGEFALVAPSLVQSGYGEREGQAPRSLDIEKPLGTVVAGGQKHALVAAFLAKHYGGNYTGDGTRLGAPMHTVTAVDHHSLVTAFMAQHNTGNIGRPMTDPVSTVVGSWSSTQGLVTSHLLKLHGTCADGQEVTKPLPTIRAMGTHLAEVRAFLVKHAGLTASGEQLGLGFGGAARDRLGLVALGGVDFAIADIGMRMLAPRELYRAQGFPDSYLIDVTCDGEPLTTTAQVRMCGNSVCPPIAAAIVRAQFAAVEGVQGVERVA